MNHSSCASKNYKKYFSKKEKLLLQIFFILPKIMFTWENENLQPSFAFSKSRNGKKINHSLHSICCKILMLYMYLNVIWMPEQKVKYYVNGLNIIFFMRKIFNKKSKITGWRRCKIDIKSPFIPLALILSAVTLSMVDHCSGNIWLL